jgi:phage baseplate assembly protein W
MATQKKYYSLPLRADEIIQKKQHPNCSLEESIAQNLHLIVSTYRGESAYAEDYGCSIWDEEFKTQLSIRWKEDVRQSVITAINKFESRLEVSDVKVDLSEDEFRPDKTSLRVRRKVILIISGIIKKTNEKFNFKKSLFISPLSQL